MGIDPAVSSFETSRIKEPLIRWLQPYGWNHKGFLGSLFVHELGPPLMPMGFTHISTCAIFTFRNPVCGYEGHERPPNQSRAATSWGHT